MLMRGEHQDETEIKCRRTLEISEHRANLNLDLVAAGKKPITYKPLQLVKIHDEYHDDVEWKERQKAWQVSFENTKDLDCAKGHVNGERDHNELKHSLQRQRDLLPEEADDAAWSDLNEGALKENFPIFCCMRRLMDQSYYENKYAAIGLFGRSGLKDPMALTQVAVEVGWRLGFFREKWKDQNWMANGKQTVPAHEYDLLCQRALFSWMPSGMRTGFTLYCQDFFDMCTSHDHKVRKIIYTFCYRMCPTKGRTKPDPSRADRSLPTKLQYCDAVILKVARELHDQFGSDMLLEPFNKRRRTENLTTLQVPLWRKKPKVSAKAWVGKFGIGEVNKGAFNQVKFDNMTLRESKETKKVREWLEADDSMTMTGWFSHREAGKYRIPHETVGDPIELEDCGPNNHTNWDRTRQLFTLKEPGPIEDK